MKTITKVLIIVVAVAVFVSTVTILWGLSLQFILPFQESYGQWVRFIEVVDFGEDIEVLDSMHDKTVGLPSGGNDDNLAYSYLLIIRSPLPEQVLRSHLESVIEDINSPTGIFSETGPYNFEGISTYFRYTYCRLTPFERCYGLIVDEFDQMYQEARQKYGEENMYVLLYERPGKSWFFN